MSPLPGDDGGQDGHMLSFNHYAYGAVIDWVYRHVAGLSPTLDAPGYREVVVAPKPSRSIGWARAAIESSFGAIRIDWRLGDEDELAIAGRAPVRRPRTPERTGDGVLRGPGRRRNLSHGGDAVSRDGTPSA